MIALVLGENDPAQILMSQFLVDGLRARGFQVEHILMDPPPKARNLLTGLQAERCLREKSPVMAAPLKPALVINLNSGLPAAKLAVRYTQSK